MAGIEDKTDMKKQLPGIRKRINSIIDRKEMHTEAIEMILDKLLVYAVAGIGDKEFQKLNAYYASIAPGNAAIYESNYRQQKI